MSKPREFELFYSGLSGNWSVRNFNNYHGDDDQYINVIEHSAYQSLKDENDRLKEALDYIRSCHLTGQVVDGLDKIIGKNK